MHTLCQVYSTGHSIAQVPYIILRANGKTIFTFSARQNVRNNCLLQPRLKRFSPPLSVSSVCLAYRWHSINNEFLYFTFLNRRAILFYSTDAHFVALKNKTLGCGILPTYCSYNLSLWMLGSFMKSQSAPNYLLENNH